MAIMLNGRLCLVFWVVNDERTTKGAKLTIYAQNSVSFVCCKFVSFWALFLQQNTRGHLAA